MATSLAAMSNLFLMLLATVRAAEGVKVVPKLDISDDGIKPEISKEVSTPTLNPTEVKAVLEVNLVQSTPPKDPRPETNQVLICTVDGKCKLHVVNNSKEEDQEEEVVYKPVIVSGLDVDAEKEVWKGKDKKIPKVPVFVAHKGAVSDSLPLRPGYDPNRRRWGQGTDRLPVYYGLKLGPEFHQPGHAMFRPVEYAPLHPRHPAISQLIPGPGARYPNPYGKFPPRDGVRTVITPFGRRSNQGAVHWPAVVGVNGKVDLVEEAPSIATSPDLITVVSKLDELLDSAE